MAIALLHDANKSVHEQHLAVPMICTNTVRARNFVSGRGFPLSFTSFLFLSVDIQFGGRP